MILIAYCFVTKSFGGIRLVSMLYVTYGVDVITPIIYYFGCTDVICNPYCPHVIEHCVRHRCSHAYFI